MSFNPLYGVNKFGDNLPTHIKALTAEGDVVCYMALQNG